MRKFALVALAGLLMSLGLMANKCEYNPTYNQPSDQQQQDQPTGAE